MDAQRVFRFGVSICTFLSAALLGACAGESATAPAPTAADLPATAVIALPATSTPLPTETAIPTATAIPSSTPLACSPWLAYLSDLTIPDNSVVPPGSALDKRWSVQNSGTCDWDAEYALRLISGEDMGAAEKPLYPARAGTQAQIQVDLTAPLAPGWYTSTWQAVAPDGTLFGDPLTIAIFVQQP